MFPSGNVLGPYLQPSLSIYVRFYCSVYIVHFLRVVYFIEMVFGAVCVLSSALTNDDRSTPRRTMTAGSPAGVLSLPQRQSPAAESAPAETKSSLLTVGIDGKYLNSPAPSLFPVAHHIDIHDVGDARGCEEESSGGTHLTAPESAAGVRELEQYGYRNGGRSDEECGEPGRWVNSV